MEKIILKKIILDQRENFDKEKDIVERKIDKNIFNSNKIVVITGIRRSGKSTLLKQISRNYESFGYINFEDDRLLNFTYDDFQRLYESFLEINPKTNTFFFDELQEIYAWEKFVSRLFDNNYKVFVTGSNAKLLSSEIATTLTGRNIKIELFPFSFSEFLNFRKINIEYKTTKNKINIMKNLQDYINIGGFPEIIKSENFNELKEIYQDILIKDLIVRFKIRDQKEFRELALFLLSNATKKISYNNLKNILGFTTTSKVKNFINFMNQAYLFFELFKYDTSVKKQIINDRKIYSIDTGLIKIAFHFSEDFGRLIENLVFLELKRRNKDIYYFDNECDFIIREGIKIVDAIQVSYLLSQNKEREIEGLKKAIQKFKLKKGKIITWDTEEKITDEIEAIPLYKFLLENE
ncbi:MAG: ATP-binding protein [Candidatus Woesearchaeota archaeon]